METLITSAIKPFKKQKERHSPKVTPLPYFVTTRCNRAVAVVLWPMAEKKTLILPQALQTAGTACKK
jgi:hypothetical protein